MYNRYIPNGASYTRIPEEDAPPSRTPPEPERLAEIGGYLPFGAGIDVIGATWTGGALDGDQLLALAATAAVGAVVGIRLFRWQ